ncbi:conserved hypothetical protein [Agrobacterium genomosp. 2 str. CFBP 5494]|uniref:Uncharacterized protein n=1 Tax=Agrobacterium genomosp. 2 str. CFBP 5494 TaxID=1183436 RepID=A0A9W5B7M7_9HYPH|nr:conserved hypothetical protein [Agrobacterium genomosp. 2 str. CFBP 5494]
MRKPPLACASARPRAITARTVSIGNESMESASSRCDCRIGQMAQLNGQFGCDLVVGQVIKQLQPGRSGFAEESDDTLTRKILQGGFIGVATIGVRRGTPDVLEALVSGNCPHGTRFPLDDRQPHVFHRPAVGEVAIGVEETNDSVDPQREEHRCDGFGQEFAHREHRTPDPQRRQDLEHEIMLTLGDFEPLACIERARVTVETVWTLCMPIEHSEHLMALSDALVDFTHCGWGAHWRLLGPCPDRSAVLPCRLTILFSPS